MTVPLWVFVLAIAVAWAVLAVVGLAFLFDYLEDRRDG